MFVRFLAGVCCYLSIFSAPVLAEDRTGPDEFLWASSGEKSVSKAIDAQLSPSGHHLFTRHEGDLWVMWELMNAVPVFGPLSGSPTRGQVAFAPDRDHFALARGNQVEIIDLEANSLITKLSPGFEVGQVSYLKTDHLVVTSVGGESRSYHPVTGKNLESPATVDSRPSDVSAGLGWDGGVLKRIDEKGDVLWTIEDLDSKRAIAEFSPDQKTVFLGVQGTDQARFVDGMTGEVKATLTLGGKLSAASFGSKGERLITVTDDGGVSYFKAGEGSPLVTFLCLGENRFFVFEPGLNYVAGASVADWIQVRYDGKVYPLVCFEAVLLNHLAITFRLQGMSLGPADLVAPPELSVEPGTDRVIDRNGSLSLTVKAKDPLGIHSIIIKVGPREWIQNFAINEVSIVHEVRLPPGAEEVMVTVQAVNDRNVASPLVKMTVTSGG